MMRSLALGAVACVIALAGASRPVAAALTAGEIVRKYGKAVVQVYASRGEDESSQASGFVVRSSGVVVTSWHVVEGADSVLIRATSGGFHTVEGLLGFDASRDLAVLKADARGLPTVRLGDSGKLKAGDRIVVIGNPQGLENTVSEGLVSAVRSLPGDYKLIQTTAPMSEGSSGAPVFNSDGEVVAVASFVLSKGQNLNFAVPWFYVSRHFERPYRPLPLGAAPEAPTAGRGRQRPGDISRAYALIREAIVSFPEDEGAQDAKARWERAAATLERAISLAPQLGEAHNWLAYCYGKLGRWADAIQAFKEAIRLKPDYAEADYNLGVAYAEVGRCADAVEAFKQAIRIKPDFAGAHYNVGVTYGKLARHAEGLEAYKQVIRLKPDYAEAHCGLGLAYGGLRRYADAVGAYREAIRLKPDYAEAHCGLGLAHAELGRYEEAVTACKEAIRLKPDYAEAHFGLGLSYEDLGRYADSVAACKEAIRLKPDLAEAHYTLGVAYGELGRHEEAVAAHEEAIRLEPDYAKAHLNLGVAYGNLGRHADGVEAFKQAIRINPDFPEAHLNLGLTYLVLGDHSGALEEYRVLKNLSAELAEKLFKLIYP
jgi:tetratricopeptide (TPR) repeat protein